jgi:methylenetetrahydrofolate reductase (NADPH)
MRIDELLATGRPCFSFEFFPPKTEEAAAQLSQTIGELRVLEPTFVSVTYGAGGSTREKTIELVSQIKRDHGVEAMAHLTCVGAPREEIATVLARLRDAGVENVLALRGDPPKGEKQFQRAAGGFAHASELAAFVAAEFGPAFCVGGACYPEGHPEALGADHDLANLKKKVDAGARFLISQLFFDNAFYFAFVKRARAAGITVPIIPGIMPVQNVSQIERFTLMCGATLPPRFRIELDRRRDDPAAVAQLGIAYATAQAVGLLLGGAPGIHFYTLNRSTATREIFAALRGGVSL